jgi:hypothetical protein
MSLSPVDRARSEAIASVCGIRLDATRCCQATATASSVVNRACPVWERTYWA